MVDKHPRELYWQYAGGMLFFIFFSLYATVEVYV
jgi:hypothetical protein